MKKFFFLSVLAFCVNLFASVPVKREYTLLSPVPNFLLREFEPERPSKTRTPFTIDPGHFMIEGDFAGMAQRSRQSDQLHFMQTLFRLGINDKLELQIQPEFYVKEGKKEGIGNTFLGYKYNFFGNDRGNIVSAFVPYAIIPTSSSGLFDRRLEGGISFPFSYLLKNGSQIEFTLELNNVRKNQQLEWQTNYIQGISLAHNLTQDLMGHIELYNEQGFHDRERNKTTFDLALQYRFSRQFKVDTGTFIGLSPYADDLVYFVGGAYLY